MDVSRLPRFVYRLNYEQLLLGKNDVMEPGAMLTHIEQNNKNLVIQNVSIFLCFHRGYSLR